MKKTGRMFLSVMMVVSLLLSLAVSAFAASGTQVFQDDNGKWEYVVENDGTITITSVEVLKKNITIPSKIEGMAVTKLGDGLFKDHSDVTSVTIPLGVKVIGNNAFEGCPKLETVIIPSTVTTIGDGAFSNCSSLGDVKIPDSVTEIGSKVFAGSEKVNVICNSDSAAEKYIQDNKSEISNYSITVVNQNTYVSSSSNSTDGVKEKNLVTYYFGKQINGKYEYTLVLEDKNPNLNLKDYINNTTYTAALDESLTPLLNAKYALVSLEKYDGNTTEDLVKNGNQIGQISPFINYVESTPYYGYNIFFFNNTQNAELTKIQFDFSENLTQYTEVDGTWTNSLVKYTHNYAIYSDDSYQSEAKDADGNVLTSGVVKSAGAHIIPVVAGTDGKRNCYDVYTEYSTDFTNNLKYIYKEATAYFSTTVDKVNGYARITTDLNGKKLNSNTTQTNYSSNEIMDQYSQHIEYNSDGGITQLNHNYLSHDLTNNIYEIGNHNLHSYVWNYERTYTNYTETGTVTHNEEIYFDDVTVRADSYVDAEETASASLSLSWDSVIRDNTDTHTAFETEKAAIVQKGSHIDATRTNSDGTTNSYSMDQDYLTTKDHIFVDETGKFVGWDWTWSYVQKAVANVVQDVLNMYQVSEYSFDENNQWTKTVVTVTPNSQIIATSDFLKDLPTAAELTSNTNISYKQYIYDESLASGADNWTEVSGTAVNTQSIVDGSSTVIDGDGNVLVQSTEQADMINTVNTVVDTLEADEANPNDEKFYDSAESVVENGTQNGNEGQTIDQTVEDIADGTTNLPTTNTTDEISHEHTDSGAIDTVITVDTSAATPSAS